MGALTASEAVEWMRNHNPVSAAPPWQRTNPLRMYALGLGEPWIKPLRRFVIVTPGRSGSELLVDLLDSHPDIVCDPEILAERWALPARFVAGRAVRAALSGARAYGFKLYCGRFGYQVIRDRPQYLQELSETGVQVIFLRRENTLAQAISAAMAMKSRWHYRRQDDASFTPLALDPVEVLVLAYLFEENDQ